MRGPYACEARAPRVAPRTALARYGTVPYDAVRQNFLRARLTVPAPSDQPQRVPVRALPPGNWRTRAFQPATVAEAVTPRAAAPSEKSAEPAAACLCFRLRARLVQIGAPLPYNRHQNCLLLSEQLQPRPLVRGLGRHLQCHTPADEISFGARCETIEGWPASLSALKSVLPCGAGMAPTIR